MNKYNNLGIGAVVLSLGLPSENSSVVPLHTNALFF